MVKKRVLLVASSGGHWVQLSRLSPAFEGYDALYITTMQGSVAPSGDRPVRIIKDFSRSTPLLMLVNLWQQLDVMMKFKPDVIVTTGAAPGLMALWLGKRFGAHTIWIDSIANSEVLSHSGQMAKRYADLWLTQWPHLIPANEGLKSFGAVL